MTRVFVNGVEVNPDELEKFEIRCEVLDQILAEKFAEEKAG